LVSDIHQKLSVDNHALLRPVSAWRYHIIKACEDSLRRLGLEHIDLYQLHRPAG